MNTSEIIFYPSPDITYNRKMIGGRGIDHISTVDAALSGMLSEFVGQWDRVRLAGDWCGHWKWECDDAPALVIKRRSERPMYLTLGSASWIIIFDECGAIVSIDDPQGTPITATAAEQLAEAIWQRRRYAVEWEPCAPSADENVHDIGLPFVLRRTRERTRE